MADRSTGMSSSSQANLPLKEIPGGYGIPFFSAIKDRLDFHYFQGNDGFFQARVDKYGSTVVRSNMAPGPFISKNSRAVLLLDAASFPVLFDQSKVEKRDLLVGLYMPPLSLTGGLRMCAYLDPSEPKHATLKQLMFQLTTSRKSHFIPEFHSTFSALFDKAEADLAASGTSDFNKGSDAYSFEYLGKALFGTPPSMTELGMTGGDKATKWLVFNLHPMMSLGLPAILEDPLLHTFNLPPFLVKSDYDAIYKYLSSAAGEVLDDAEALGLEREEACHNILFMICMNAFGGMKLLFPSILRFLAKSDRSLHSKLADEIRSAVKSAGGKVTLAAIESMELSRSFVYESLRMDPPVKLQNAKAKTDFIVSSHEACFKIKKGELLVGYQPFATNDEKVFGPDAKKFVPERFVGEGKKLLKYVLWSNGPENESSTLQNKQCAGKDMVVLMANLLLVEFFLRYDTFDADVSTILLGAQVTITSLTKAANNVLEVEVEFHSVGMRRVRDLMSYWSFHCVKILYCVPACMY